MKLEDGVKVKVIRSVRTTCGNRRPFAGGPGALIGASGNISL